MRGVGLRRHGGWCQIGGGIGLSGIERDREAVVGGCVCEEESQRCGGGGGVGLVPIWL